MILAVLVLSLAVTCVTSLSCQKGWLQYQENCYGFFVEPVNWLLAGASCRAQTARLTEIEDAGENQFIVSQLQKLKFDSTWVGGSARLHIGTYEWVPTLRRVGKYTNWDQGEPNNYNGKEHCLELSKVVNYRWNDFNCLENRPFVCKRKADVK
uniref:C-type lectin domain-containing protein n=1 Tax=Arion vulgaris TaxID=1028688 RepID=A0A0B6ZB52_9EUPU